MKRILPLLLALGMLCGCSEKQPVETTPFERSTPTYVTSSTATQPSTTTPEPPPEEPEVNTKTAQIQVLRCSWQERILPADFEVYVGHFPEEEGKVYVDLALQVYNTCDETIDQADISAYFDYAGNRYTMQFEVEDNAGDFANQYRNIHPGECKTVHLFYKVAEDARKDGLTVHFTALGLEQEIAVEEPAEPEKRTLAVGETFLREEQYSLEVLDCRISSQFGATGDNAVMYHVEGSDVFGLTLKVQNIGQVDLDFLEGYLLAGEQPEFAAVQLEVNENRELEDWEAPIAPGQEEIVHIWVAVPQDTPSAGMALRFNVQGDSFCCYAIA